MIGCFGFQERGGIDETKSSVNWKMVKDGHWFLILLFMLVYV